MTSIAIIGAGLAGLTLAGQLGQLARVRLFEKARGVSGRSSTRYADPFQFDHGAQYFTARSDAFKAWLAPHIEAGRVQPWQPNVVTLEKNKKPYKRDWFEPHYVAAPKMNDLCKHIARDLDVSIATEIAALTRSADGWVLHDKNDETHGPFDWVISTTPAPQAAALLPSTVAQHEAIAQVRMTGCYSLMLGFTTPPNIAWHAAVVNDSPIGWMAVNSHKPNRDTSYSLLVQSTPEWADANIDEDVPAMQQLLLQELQELLGITLSPDHIATHRWKYAGVAKPLGTDYMLDSTMQLGACGDWCIKGRVEAAFTSAQQLAGALKKRLAPNP